MKKAMDIFALIKEDHRMVEDLFEKIDATTERGAKKRAALFSKLKEELTKHAHGEEVALYPRLMSDTESKALGWESVEEHGVVKYLVARLDDTPGDAEEWMGLATVLKEVVEHHVEEEEKEMFSFMREMFSKEELETMASEFVAAKADTDLEVDGAPILPRANKSRKSGSAAAA